MDKDIFVSLKSNTLEVNGKKLHADILPIDDQAKIPISPEELEWMLSTRSLGRTAILSRIQAANMQKGNYATHTSPSVWTVQLSTELQTHRATNRVFTQKGYDLGETRTQSDDILDEFHGHWNAVINSGFVPEVRKNSIKNDSGAWLLVRKPSVEQIAKHWFGFTENRNMVAARALPGLDSDRINLYGELGKELVEETESDRHSELRMGLNLAVAALKRSIGNIDGFVNDVEDTRVQANNDIFRNVGAVRAIENSIYEYAASASR